MKLSKIRPLGYTYGIQQTKIIIARIGVMRSRVVIVLAS
jgi:hypothetical protein